MSYAGYPGAMGAYQMMPPAYQNPAAAGMYQQPTRFPAQPGYQGPAYLPAQAQTRMQEESFIENILRLNHGKVGTFYFTYQGNGQWNAKVYRGRVETAGRDHIIISDTESGKRYLLLMSNLDWVEFDEKLNYPRMPERFTNLQTTE